MTTRNFFIGFIALAVAACGARGTDRSERGEPTASTASAVVVCPSGATVEGIDVSEFQGSIDWAAVKASGRDFGIARVSDGTGHIDPTFPTNWAGMKAAGVVRGVYQFFRPGEDGTAQADVLLTHVGTLEAGDLPPVLDVEVSDGYGSGTIVAGIAAWVARVQQATGLTPMIYTAPGFWNGVSGTGQFAAETLWVANWQVNCPDTPGTWGSWKFWQYADNGNVPGIGGAVDLDQFNGTLADLQAFAGPANNPPKGYLDQASCASITGWTQDVDVPTTAIAVHLYFNAGAGQPGAIGVPFIANVHRADLCTAIGSCDHGFSVVPPMGLMDDKPHAVFAYGIDDAGGPNTLLTGSPQSFTCAPPAPPVTRGNGVKRWITNPASLAAWKLDTLWDLAHYPQADVDAYASGPDLPATPECVQADDGTPEVWLIDGAVRRHVINPDSLAAWRLTVVKTPAKEVYAHPKGLDLRPAPFMMVGDTAPNVYLLDDAPPTSPPVGDGGVVTPPAPGGLGAPDGGPAGNGSPSATDGSSGSSGGCAITERGESNGVTTWGLAALAVVTLGRRRSRRSSRARRRAA